MSPFLMMKVTVTGAVTFTVGCAEVNVKRVPLKPRLARGEAVHSYEPALEGAVEVTCIATNSFTSSLSLAPLACIPILLVDALKPLVYPSVEPNNHAFLVDREEILIEEGVPNPDGKTISTEPRLAVEALPLVTVYVYV